MKEVNLSHARLKGACMRGAQLRGATLSGADLEEADLEGAILFEADLTGANLNKAVGTSNEQLNQAKSLQGATMPDGLIHS